MQNSTVSKCRLCYLTPYCAFCMEHRDGDGPYPAPVCMQQRDMDTQGSCTVSEAWFPGRENYKNKYGEGALPGGVSRTNHVPIGVDFCDHFYRDTWITVSTIAIIVIASLCPVIVCATYCCSYCRPCPLVPPVVTSQHKYAIERFFNSGSKYGYPGSGGTLYGNYWQYVYNNDEYLSIIFAHPHNPFGRVKRFLGQVIIIIWKIFASFLLSDSNVYVKALVLTFYTAPLRLVIEEIARARLLHMIGCGVCLAERLSIIFISTLLVGMLILYMNLHVNGIMTANQVGSVIISLVQSWILSNIILRLNFTTINSWKGGYLFFPQLRSADDEEELSPNKGCTICKYSPAVSFITKTCLFGAGAATYLEDKTKFFEEMGNFKDIDEYLQVTEYGKHDYSGKTAMKELIKAGGINGYVLDKNNNLVPRDSIEAGNQPRLSAEKPDRTSRSSIELYARPGSQTILSQPRRSETRHWRYLDMSGREQGDFTTDEMRSWFDGGFFIFSTRIRHASWERFFEIQEVYGGSSGAFTYIPPEPRQHHQPLYYSSGNSRVSDVGNPLRDSIPAYPVRRI